jgi:hypothetical protein
MKALEGFDDLLALGRMTRPVNVGTHEFKLHTLNSLEYSRMTRSAGEDPKATTAERFEILQRWTLSYAVESIDDKPVTPEQVSDLLSKAQLVISNTLYDSYAEMVTEQNKLLDSAKKNSSAEATS